MVNQKELDAFFVKLANAQNREALISAIEGKTGPLKSVPYHLISDRDLRKLAQEVNLEAVERLL